MKFLIDWLKHPAPLFHSLKSKTWTNRDWLTCIFPPFPFSSEQSLFSSKECKYSKGAKLTVLLHSQVAHTVTLARSFVLCSFPRIFEEKRNCSQSSFASATSDCFELCLAQCIFWVLCNLLERLPWRFTTLILLAAMITQFPPVSLDSSEPAFQNSTRLDRCFYGLSCS